MKPLHILNNTEKGRLLADLFPDEIALFLDALKAFCVEFRENKEVYAQNWNNGFMPFEYWQQLSAETEALLNRHIFNMKKRSKVFADQLYFSYTALFVNDRMVKYAQKCQNDKFKIAVTLFYNVS